MRLLILAVPALLVACAGDKSTPGVDDIVDTGTPSDDGDRDGWSGLEDCDDEDGAVNPGAEEVCDGVDNDCDGEIDELDAAAGTWYTDADGDGYGTDASAVTSCEQPDGAVAEGGDCDEADPTTTATERSTKTESLFTTPIMTATASGRTTTRSRAASPARATRPRAETATTAT